MIRDIIADVRDGQTRVAILEDGELVELFMEGEGKWEITGNVYRGKVENVLPGMQAAFVDIGLEKNAFLYVDDIILDGGVFEFSDEQGISKNNALTQSIGGMISKGQELTVQILKEPIGTKGARVTTQITLPGRYMVLMPLVDYIGVSRRIEDEGERQRLKGIAEEIRPVGMGLIVRTAAKGRKEEDFLWEIDFLSRLWGKIQTREQKGKVPRALYQDEGIIYRIIRDFYTPDMGRIIINDKEEYDKLMELADVLFPGLADKMELFDHEEGIFQYYNIEPKIEKALQRKVWLKSGGYIIIDPTEALTVIDVNTGKFVGSRNLEDTVLKTNLEAAREIAHQIRLRDIGGIILIDFIDMDVAKNRERVLEVLNHSLKKDRVKTSILGFTGLGLVEMTRKKIRGRLSTKLLKDCPHCHGTGRVHSEVMSAIKTEK